MVLLDRFTARALNFSGVKAVFRTYQICLEIFHAEFILKLYNAVKI